MYKKILIVALTISMLLMLAGCKAEEVKETTVAAIAETTETTEATAGDVIIPIPDTDDEVVVQTTESEKNQTAAVDDDSEGDSDKNTESENMPDNTDSQKPDSNAESEKSVTEYEWFMALSGREQKEYMYSYPSIDDFLIWLENAEQEYKELHPSIEINGEPIDAEEIIEVIG